MLQSYLKASLQICLINILGFGMLPLHAPNPKLPCKTANRVTTIDMHITFWTFTHGRGFWWTELTSFAHFAQVLACLVGFGIAAK